MLTSHALTPPRSELPRRLGAWAAALLIGWSMSGCTSLPTQVQRTPSSALTTPASTALGAMLERQRVQAGTPYHSAFLLLGGAEAAYVSRLALIQAAEKTLDIQYYAIHADASTARLLQEVVLAAARGVRVRVLLDDFHSAGKDAQVMRLAFVPGIEMRMFNPVMGARNSPPLRALSTLTDFTRAQQRMHNKLFIADNAAAIAGGRNLGDAYFDALDSDNFIDLDVLAAGGVVRQLSHSFDRYWNDRRSYPVQSLLTLAELDTMRGAGQSAHMAAAHADGAAATPAAPPASSSSQDGAQALLHLPPMDLRNAPWIWAAGVVIVDTPAKVIQPEDGEGMVTAEATAAPDHPSFTAPAAAQTLVQRAPHSGPSTERSASPTANQQTLRRVLPPINAQGTVVDGLLTLVDLAQTQLLVVSPYFVPGDDMKAAFRRAVQRGVKVHILTNSLASNDAPLAHAGYARHRKELLEMGVQLYELRSLQSQRRTTLRDTAGRISGSSGQSRAMLHSKLMVVDGQLTVVGSMNLDMRSQLQNTEIALLVASRKLSAQAATHIQSSLQENVWKLALDEKQRVIWQAPAGSDWGDRDSEPDASLPLRMMIRLIGPLAPDHLL